MFNLYADVDARSMIPSRNTRSFILRSVPSSHGRSFLQLIIFLTIAVTIYNLAPKQVVARHGEPADVICAKEPFLMTQARFFIYLIFDDPGKIFFMTQARFLTFFYPIFYPNFLMTQARLFFYDLGKIFLMTQARLSTLCLIFSFSPRLDSLQLLLTILRCTK